MNTTKKAVNLALGNIEAKDLVSQTGTLVSTDGERGSIFETWNDNLIEGKWYEATPMTLPLEFIDVTMRQIAIEWINKLSLAKKSPLGYYQEVDGLSKRVDKKHAEKLEDTSKLFHLTIDTMVSNTKPSSKLKAVKKVVSEINRTFRKDVWAKRIVQWQNQAQILDNTENETEAKPKADRDFVETCAWNILGEPDRCSPDMPYSGSLNRKCINDKNDMIDVDKFEALAKKFIADLKKLS